MKKIVVITGGTRGIGYHLSIAFEQAGYEVFAFDKVQHHPLPHNIHFMEVDVRSEARVNDAFELIYQDYGGVDVLVNNAAISHFCKPLVQTTLQEFDDVLAVNIKGAYNCAKAFLHANKAQPYGRIINIASTRFDQNEAHWEAYGASKGALVSFTHSLAISLSGTRVSVNAISPGWIQVDDYDALREVDHNQHPSGRVGIPRDITRVALFLAEEESDFINAQNIIVDGGMTKKMIYEP
ncbi:MAG: SDR family NAD(P)-dependent oxidoreductase [Erysipelotrichaceae bacterium]